MGLGNVFGGSFGDVLNVALPALGGIFGGPAGMAVGGVGAALLTGGPDTGGAVVSTSGTPVMYEGAAYTDASLQTPWMPAAYGPINGEVQPVALPAAIGLFGMSRTLALALARVASRMGVAVTLATVGRFGLRLYRSLVGFSRRHPTIAVTGILASLGMGAAEVAEFLTWGAMKRRRRRGGISSRDIRIARRTIRRISAFQADLGGMRRGGRRGRGVAGGVQVVRAG